MFDWIFKPEKRKEENKHSTIGGDIRRVGCNYETDSCLIRYDSSLLIGEANKIIGKTIEKIVAEKEKIIFIFEDGSSFSVSGFTLDEEGKRDSLDTLFEDKIINI